MNNDPLEELEELLLKHADTGLTEPERRRLNVILAEHPEARRHFAREQTMDAMLHLESAAGLDGTGTLAPAAEPERKRNTIRIRVEQFALAALVLIALGLAFLLGKQNPADGWDEAFAKIEFLSDDARFAEDHQLSREEGSLLGKGWVQLEQGRIRLVFRSGASVEVDGPAALGIDTALRAYLDYGRVDVFAPESARDFTISTESMEVVDLGTRFLVSVDPQSRESEVSVIEGLVDLHLGSRGAERRIRPLEAGYAARVDASGKMVEITHASATPPASKAAEPRILAHWTFDEWGADGRIKDSSGNRLDGTLRAGKRPDLVPGVSGQALAFTRSQAVDLREHLATFGPLDAFTFAAWVRDPAERLAMLFSCSGDSERHRVQFYLSPGHVYYGWQDGLHFDSMSGRVDGWESGRWYHVAVSVMGDTARLYRNGELIASGSAGSRIGTPVSNPSVIMNLSHAYLGRLEDGRQGEEKAPQWFTGHMDDVQLYSGALSQENIQFLYQNPGWTIDPEK